MIHTAELICKLNNHTFSSLAEALPEPKMIKDGNNTVIYQNFPNYGIKITLKCYDSDKCNRPFYFVYLILNLAKLIGQNDSSQAVTLSGDTVFNYQTDTLFVAAKDTIKRQERK